MRVAQFEVSGVQRYDANHDWALNPLPAGWMPDDVAALLRKHGGKRIRSKALEMTYDAPTLEAMRAAVTESLAETAPLSEIPGRTPTGQDQTPVNSDGTALQDVILYAVGGAGTEPHPAVRAFPLINRQTGEAESAHLARVASLLAEAMAAGGTHLLVPREHADWLGDHPLIVDYFAKYHELAEAGAETGIVLALRPPESVAFSIEVDEWETLPGEAFSFIARRKLVAPKLTLRPSVPAHGLLRGRLVLSSHGLRTLRVGFALGRPGRGLLHGHEVVLSLARPGALYHDLPFVEATFDRAGAVQLEFDLELDDDLRLDRIRLELVEEDNWRVHPAFGGGDSFALPATAPAGARLEVRELTLGAAATVRRGPAFGIVRGARPAPYHKPAGRPRDAVMFSSWAPEEGLDLGDYFIGTLRRWHADSKIFVGINHGSSPRWRERLETSGLDVTIAPAAPTLTMPCDPTGFVAALEAYRRHQEPFELVWFGHTKGMSHLDDPRYATGRWTIERMFWSRRAEIARFFLNPVIGLYAPHYLMMKQSHLRQTDALLRMYQATYMPLGAMALSTHFVMRDESVRDFCARVDERFFREGPEPFGGDRFFFEMAMPNVPTMQGYEPSIEPGLGGASGPPKLDGRESIHNDWRQNHAVVAMELEQWRQDRTRFRTRHRQHAYAN